MRIEAIIRLSVTMKDYRDPDTIPEINQITGTLFGGEMGFVLSFYINYGIPEVLSGRF